jgi:hypothetical protein
MLILKRTPRRNFLARPVPTENSPEKITGVFVSPETHPVLPQNLEILDRTRNATLQPLRFIRVLPRTLMIPMTLDTHLFLVHFLPHFFEMLRLWSTRIQNILPPLHNTLTVPGKSGIHLRSMAPKIIRKGIVIKLAHVTAVFAFLVGIIHIQSPQAPPSFHILRGIIPLLPRPTTGG